MVRAGCAPGEGVGAVSGSWAGMGKECSPMVPEEQSRSGDSSWGQLTGWSVAGRQFSSEEAEAKDTRSVIRVRISISAQQQDRKSVV